MGMIEYTVATVLGMLGGFMAFTFIELMRNKK